MDASFARGHSGRASAYEQVADGILELYGIYPIRFCANSDNESKREPIKYGNKILGMCAKRLIPDLKFLREIVWLYEQAEEEYNEALRLDPTDTSSYIRLSYVLRQLGRNDEATNYIDRALTILNKAILADNQDKQSYSERANIFEQSGQIELAVSDLERLPTLSTNEYEINSTRQKIEELRKDKAP